jgi:hypothetical protein
VPKELKHSPVEYETELEARLYCQALAEDIRYHLQVADDCNEPGYDKMRECLEFFFDQVYNLRLDNVYGTQPEEVTKKMIF